MIHLTSITARLESAAEVPEMLSPSEAVRIGRAHLKYFLTLLEMYFPDMYGETPMEWKQFDYQTMKKVMNKLMRLEDKYPNETRQLFKVGMSVTGYMVMSRKSGWTLF